MALSCDFAEMHSNQILQPLLIGDIGECLGNFLQEVEELNEDGAPCALAELLLPGTWCQCHGNEILFYGT